MVYTVGKEEKKLLSCPKLAPFFAGGGLSRQWKKSRLFLQHVVLWGVIFVRNFLPSSLNYFLCETTFRKKCALQKQWWLFKVWLSFWLMTRQLSQDHLASIWPTSAQQHDFFKVKSDNLINIFTGSWCWNRHHHGQTIHPTEKFISMNLFEIICVVT